MKMPRRMDSGGLNDPYFTEPTDLESLTREELISTIRALLNSLNMVASMLDPRRGDLE